MSDVAARASDRKGDLWDRYVNLGLARLHPIIPPGAAPASSWIRFKTTPDDRQHGRCLTPERAQVFWVNKHAVGKLPGVWAGDGWAPRNVQGDEARLRQVYAPDRLGSYRWSVAERGGGIGVSGTALLGLDVDVVDVKVAREVAAALSPLVGLTAYPFRVGRAPKFLIPFRLAKGASPFAKPSRLELGEAGAVEWLTTGQQWVLEGVHGGTGLPYRWPAGRLWEWPGGLAAVPEIDEDHAVGLLRRLGRVLGLGGGGVGIRKGRMPEARVALPGGPGETPVARAARVAELLCDEADARAMVAAIPNLGPTRDQKTGTPREEYVSMAHHLLGCSGGAVWGRALFMEWAARYPTDNPEYNEDVWDGLSGPHTGWRALLARAERAGWLGGQAFRLAQARRAFARQESPENTKGG